MFVIFHHHSIFLSVRFFYIEIERELERKE